ncbi:MAG TPA: hypothetical protein VGF74_08985 [Thermoleophilaceae bacterium]|jgi:hypothetical protein
MTASPQQLPDRPVHSHVEQIERWLGDQPAREFEGDKLRAEPFYVRADEEFGVALVAVGGTRPDGTVLELPFESWWFSFEHGRISRAWSL